MAGRHRAVPSCHDDFIALMRALYSAEHGASVDWNYKNHEGAGHRVHDADKQLLWSVKLPLAHCGR